MNRFSRLAALLLALPILLGAAPRAGAGREPVSATASVVAVEVPVVVLEDGKPMRGLTRDDFLLDDGRSRQTLTGFEVLDLASPASRQTPVALVPAAARRHFLLLFDLTFSEPPSILKAREAAQRLLDGALHPTDLVAVATFSLAEGPRLVLGFTSDRRQVRRAIDSLGLPQLIDRNPDPLALLLPEIREAEQATGNPRAAAALAELKGVALREARSHREQQQARISAFTRAVSDLAKLMGSVEGRKHVVLLSEGFDSALLLGTVAEVRIRETNRDAASGAVWQVDSNERFGYTKASSDLFKMLEEFKRADCAIQAVDIGGLRADSVTRGKDEDGAGPPSGEDSLFMMAEGTGGELYRNFNDLSQAMADLLARNSVTYVLTFQPAELALDGKYHPLRVRLKDERRGLRVLHRPGYYAPLPYAQQSVPARQLAGAALMLGGEAGGSVPLAVLAAPYPVAGQKAYVPVLVEIDGAALAGEGAQGTLQAELLAYAFDEAGEIRDHFGQVLGLDLGKVGPALGRGGLKYYGHLDLDPGRYVVRVLVRDGKGAHGLATAEVTVPGAGAASAPTVLLPPLFPDPPAPNRWLLVREGEARQKLRQVPYPFLLGDQPFIPAARPLLPAGGEAKLALVGWGLGPGALAATAELYAADGAPHPGGDLRLEERASPGVGGSEQVRATFRPGHVPAGPYTLVVTLTDPAAGAKWSSTLPVTITADSAAAR